MPRKRTDPTRRRNFGRVNRDLFIRTVCLLGSFVVFTQQGAALGKTVLAANAVLFQLHLLMAAFFDGLANAGAILAGRAAGTRNPELLDQTVKRAAQWGVGVALILALVHLAFREGIVAAFTQQPAVQEVVHAHWGWVVLWPLAGFWGLLLNGAFVGATVTGPIRNAFLAAFAVYLASLWLFVPLWRNHGLWLSFLLFTLMRSVVLGVYVPRLMAWSRGR